MARRNAIPMGEAVYCLNCRTTTSPDDYTTHQAPCEGCNSSAHAGCQCRYDKKEG